jgi:hypothetical protein
MPGPRLRPAAGAAAAALAAALLTACAAQLPGPALVGVDGQPCAGTVAAAAGLARRPDAELLARARGRPGEGRLCDGRTYVARAPVTVHRLWDSSRPSSEFGVWWALEPPHGSRDDYRRKYAICPGWSRLDRVTTCTLKPGTPLVLGTGESVACGLPEATLPRSAAVQAFLPELRTRFLACSSAPWPGEQP